jgi:Domain of unknown function (DUF1843)
MSDTFIPIPVVPYGVPPYGIAIRTAVGRGDLDGLKAALAMAEQLYARDGDMISVPRIEAAKPDILRSDGTFQSEMPAESRTAEIDQLIKNGEISLENYKDLPTLIQLLKSEIAYLEY